MTLAWILFAFVGLFIARYMRQAWEPRELLGKKAWFTVGIPLHAFIYEKANLKFFRNETLSKLRRSLSLSSQTESDSLLSRMVKSHREWCWLIDSYNFLMLRVLIYLYNTYNCMPLDVNLVEALLYSIIRYSNDEWSALSASNFVMQQW